MSALNSVQGLELTFGRDQDSEARDSWTAEQWAAEARLCHRLDKGKSRLFRM